MRNESDDNFAFGCQVLRNERRNIDKHQKVVEKHNISLEWLADSPKWKKLLICWPSPMRKRLCCTIRILGVEIEFFNEILVKALAQLESRHLRIVLLYYVLEKTDAEICRILGMSSKEAVLYHRHRAIRHLREWMEEELEDVYEIF